jgi:hypothetical protein
VAAAAAGSLQGLCCSGPLRGDEHETSPDVIAQIRPQTLCRGQAPQRREHAGFTCGP